MGLFLKNAIVLGVILALVTCLWMFLINKEERHKIPKLGLGWIIYCEIAWALLYFTGIAA